MENPPNGRLGYAVKTAVKPRRQHAGESVSLGKTD